MTLTIHTKNFHVSEKLQGILEKKISKMEKYFDGDAACTAVCTKVGNTEKMELTITARGHAFRAQEENRSMYSNIDVVLGKIERQIVKNKEKLQAVIRKEAVDEKNYAYNRKQIKFLTPEVVKNKTFEVKPLSDEEAELAMSTIGHDFYVYANKQTGRINIIYRRTDGHSGIIEVSNATVVKK